MPERVIITGASSGIGREAAYCFAEEGARLFLVARRGDRLERAAEECRAKGSPEVRTGTHDLSVPRAGETLVREAVEAFGGLEVLICNAGYGYWGKVEELDPAAMARMTQVNLVSQYESILAALPVFRRQGRGHIVLVSSIIGKKAMAYNASYCATKFAQVGLGEALWGELRDEGIGVTVVCPGYTATEFHEVASPAEARTENRPMQGQDPSVVGRAILKGVRKNKKEIHLTAPGKTILFIDRISHRLSAWLMYRVAQEDRKRRQSRRT